MTTQNFLGRFTLSSSETLVVDGDTCTLTTGSYYTSGYSGESTSQLVEMITTAINADVTSQSTASVTHSISTNRITISLDSAVTVTMSASLAAILGFSSTTQSGASEYVGDQDPRYTWHPSNAASYYPHGITSANFWNKKSKSYIGRDDTGTTFTIPSNLLYDATIRYMLLASAEVKTPDSGTIYRDFHTFFTDVIHAGELVRIIYDDTSYTSTSSYTTGIVGFTEENKEIGSIEDFASRHITNYQGLWDVDIPFLKYVS